jgi:hypothetical protein
LTDGGVLTKSTTGFPASTDIVALATVVAGATTVTSVTDARRPFQSYGSGNLSIVNGGNVVLATTTGTKIGTATTQKLSFWNATPIIQPASANQAVLTDSTTGTASTTISNVGASFSQTTLNNNFASVVRLLNQLRNDLVAAGLIKGSA